MNHSYHSSPEPRSSTLATFADPLRGAPQRPADEPVHADAAVDPSHGSSWHQSSYELRSGVTVVECTWDEFDPQV